MQLSGFSIYSQSCKIISTYECQNIFIYPKRNPISISNLLPIPHHSAPRKPLCLRQEISLSLWVCLFSTLHINRITQHFLCVSVYFTSHNVFKVHPCCSRSHASFPFYGQITVTSYGYTHHILFICSSVGRHFVFTLTVMNNATMNICVQVFVSTYVFISPYIYLVAKLLGHMVIYLTFEKLPDCFPK